MSKHTLFKNSRISKKTSILLSLHKEVKEKSPDVTDGFIPYLLDALITVESRGRGCKLSDIVDYAFSLKENLDDQTITYLVDMLVGDVNDNSEKRSKAFSSGYLVATHAIYKIDSLGTSDFKYLPEYLKELLLAKEWATLKKEVTLSEVIEKHLAAYSK